MADPRSNGCADTHYESGRFAYRAPDNQAKQLRSTAKPGFPTAPPTGRSRRRAMAQHTGRGPAATSGPGARNQLQRSLTPIPAARITSYCALLEHIRKPTSRPELLAPVAAGTDFSLATVAKVKQPAFEQAVGPGPDRHASRARFNKLSGNQGENLIFTGGRMFTGHKPAPRTLTRMFRTGWPDEPLRAWSSLFRDPPV